MGIFSSGIGKNKEEVDLICEKKVKKSKKCDEAFLQIAKDS